MYSLQSIQKTQICNILELIRYKNPKDILEAIIPKQQLDMYLKQLTKLGFIQKLDRKYTVTNMGNFCEEFPLSERSASMLYHLHKMRYTNKSNKDKLDNKSNKDKLDDNKMSVESLFLHLAVICTIDTYDTHGAGIFYWPQKKTDEDIIIHSTKMDDAIKKFEDNFAGYSDIDTIFNVWIRICTTINPFYLTNMRQFCNTYSLNFHKLKLIIDLLKKCITIGNTQPINLNIYCNFQKFHVPDLHQLSRTFYSLLELTYQDFETTITKAHNGKFVANCNNDLLDKYQIDIKSIHKMELGNDLNKVYYTVCHTECQTNKGKIKIINVLHALPNECESEEDSFSIFDSQEENEEPIYQVGDICDLEVKEIVQTKPKFLQFCEKEET